MSLSRVPDGPLLPCVCRAGPHPTVPALPSRPRTDPCLGPVRVPILVPCPFFPVPTRVLSNAGQSPARRWRGECARGRRLSGVGGAVLPALRPSPAVGSGSGQRALLLGSCASRTAGAASLPPAQGSCPLRPELVLVWVRRCPGAGRRVLGAP